MGCHFLLQEILPTQRSNLGLLSLAMAGRFFSTAPVDVIIPFLMWVSRDSFKVIQLLNSEPGLTARFQNLGQSDTKPETLPLSNPRWCYRHLVMIGLAQLVEQSVCTLNSSHLSWEGKIGLFLYSTGHLSANTILHQL